MPCAAHSPEAELRYAPYRPLSLICSDWNAGKQRRREHEHSTHYTATKGRRDNVADG